MEISITKITLMLTDGTDHVGVHTSFPSPFPDFHQPLVLEFQVEKDKGAEYIEKVFGKKPDVIITARKKDVTKKDMMWAGDIARLEEA